VENLKITTEACSNFEIIPFVQNSPITNIMCGGFNLKRNGRSIFEIIRICARNKIRKWKCAHGNAAAGGIISKCTLGGREARVSGCLSIAAFSHSPGEFSEAHCASDPTEPPLSRPLCIFINGIIASE
jgi:hypothetical protein